jgi:hypothetical protein
VALVAVAAAAVMLAAMMMGAVEEWWSCFLSAPSAPFFAARFLAALRTESGFRFHLYLAFHPALVLVPGPALRRPHSPLFRPLLQPDRSLRLCLASL